MSTLDEIIKEKQQLGEALARVDAQRDKLTSQLSELEATERVLDRYSKGHAGKKDGLGQDPDHGNTGGRWAPAYAHRKTSGGKAELAEPQRPGPCPGNRQDAAGNYRCMQG